MEILTVVDPEIAQVIIALIGILLVILGFIMRHILMEIKDLSNKISDFRSEANKDFVTRGQLRDTETRLREQFRGFE